MVLAVLALIGALLAPDVEAQGGSLERRVNDCVDLGVARLLAAQDLDGSWRATDPMGRNLQPLRVGREALALYTLVKSGVHPRHHQVQLAVERLRTPEPARPGTTYDTAILIMALEAVEPPETTGPKAQREWIAVLTDDLLDGQRREGDWGYPAGNGDLSNTQYAALGLRAAAAAGVAISDRVWIDLAQEVLHYRQSKGGFAYNPGGGVTGSMTTAGIGTLAICRDQLQKSEGLSSSLEASIAGAIERGLRWLDRNFAVDRNPGGPGWPLYYLYGLERVGALVPTATIGEHDWYREGALHLVETQLPDGTWRALDFNGLPDTCFALLFLRRATFPRTGPDRESNSGRKETEAGELTLSALGDTPLSLSIRGWSDALRARSEWPDEAGQGPRVVRVEYLVDGVVVGALAGNADAPARLETFTFQHTFEEPGRHLVSARAQLLVLEEFGGTRRSRIVTADSPELGVDIENVCPEWMLAFARDTGRSLIPPGHDARASSTCPQESGPTGVRFLPRFACDGHPRTLWLADPQDEQPTLTIDLRRSVRANVLQLSHARTVPVLPGYYGRALEIEVDFGDQRVHRVRMHPDERRRTRLVLPEAIAISRIELRLLYITPARGPLAAAGLSEVELLLEE